MSQVESRAACASEPAHGDAAGGGATAGAAAQDRQVAKVRTLVSRRRHRLADCGLPPTGGPESSPAPRRRAAAEPRPSPPLPTRNRDIERRTLSLRSLLSGCTASGRAELCLTSGVQVSPAADGGPADAPGTKGAADVACASLESPVWVRRSAAGALKRREGMKGAAVTGPLDLRKRRSEEGRTTQSAGEARAVQDGLAGAQPCPCCPRSTWADFSR